jgi:hypothetical protein
VRKPFAQELPKRCETGGRGRHAFSFVKRRSGG